MVSPEIKENGMQMMLLVLNEPKRENGVQKVYTKMKLKKYKKGYK